MVLLYSKKKYVAQLSQLVGEYLGNKQRDTPFAQQDSRIFRVIRSPKLSECRGKQAEVIHGVNSRSDFAGVVDYL